MKVVKFLKSNSPYHKGDIAGFSKEIADRLIKAEVAQDFNAEAEKMRKAKNQK